MKKLLLIAFMATIMFCGAAFIGAGAHFGTVQAATSVSGIIDTDTTWTKANSPYNLTGNMAIDEGVTLTIEPGVVVNLGNYIKVDGTLYARGTNIDKILFEGESGLLGYGSIVFTKYSSSWNEQTGLGSILENAILNFKSTAISISSTSPKINKNYILGSIDVHGSGPWVPEWTEASPIISNNNITSTGFPEAIQSSGLPSIINNTIKGGVTSSGHGRTTISNNVIDGNGACGIQANSNSDYIVNNTIYNCGTGVRTSGSIIENNVIANNQVGVLLWLNGNPTIRNNTIVNNEIGISVPGYSSESLVNNYNIQASYNNIYGNSEYNIKLYMDGAYPKGNINATYNWWGTTDESSIDQTIYDFNDDYRLGEVNFIPFLTAPNPKAMPDSNAQIPTLTPIPSPANSPSTSSTPSQEPGQTDPTEAIVGAAIAVAVFGAGLGLLVYLVKRK